MKGSRYDYDIYKKNRPITPKDIVNVFDLGCLGVEKDYPEQLSSLPNRKKRETWIYLQKKKWNITKTVLKKEL